MIRDYLRAGYPALCLLTQEPNRIHQIISCDGWQFMSWDCTRGITETRNNSLLDEIRDPIEALKWLNVCTNTVLLANNLHLFLESPEVIQAIQNGVVRWKSTGCALCLVAPTVRLPLELEKQMEVEVNHAAAYRGTGLDRSFCNSPQHRWGDIPKINGLTILPESQYHP